MAIKLAPYIRVRASQAMPKRGMAQPVVYEVSIVMEPVTLYTHFGDKYSGLTKPNAEHLAAKLDALLEYGDIRWE